MPNEVAVLKVRQVAPGSSRRVDVEGRRIAVVRFANADGSDDWYAIGDECSHADWSLSEGDVWEAEREIECQAFVAEIVVSSDQLKSSAQHLGVARRPEQIVHLHGPLHEIDSMLV